MTGHGNVNFVNDFMDFANKDNKDPIKMPEDKATKYVHDFPYILYYRL